MAIKAVKIVMLLFNTCNGCPFFGNAAEYDAHDKCTKLNRSMEKNLNGKTWQYDIPKDCPLPDTAPIIEDYRR